MNNIYFVINYNSWNSTVLGPSAAIRRRRRVCYTFLQLSDDNANWSPDVLESVTEHRSGDLDLGMGKSIEHFNNRSGEAGNPNSSAGNDGRP